MGRRLVGRRQWQVHLLLLLLATTASGPLLLNADFLNTRGGGDSPFLLFRLHQLLSALRDGHFPVRWMPDAAYGFGYPFFSYYAALPYYLAAGLVYLGSGLVAALKATQWLGFGLAAYAAWGLVRCAGGDRRAAWIAALAYTFAPYHLVNVYVRGDSLSEFWAMGLFPLILWMAARLWQRPSARRMVLFALSYAVLVLTHNVSALTFSPILFIFLALLALDRGGADNLGLAAGVFLGLALSAFFWLPALAERDAVQLTAQTTGYFHYSNHFRVLAGDEKNLIQPKFLFDYDVAGSTPFSMGLIQALLTVAAVIIALVRPLHRRLKGADSKAPTFRPSQPAKPPYCVIDGTLTAFSLITLLLSTFLITPASGFLWERVPLRALQRIVQSPS